MTLHGKPFTILSFHERKKVWSVHVFYEPNNPKELEIFEINGVWEVYYQKDGFPMVYAFGLSASENVLSEVIEIAWNNINKYKRWFK